MKDGDRTKEALVKELSELRGRIGKLENRHMRDCGDEDFSLCAVFESAMDGMFVIDLKGRYQDVNPAGCGMFGYSKEEFLSSDISLLLFPEDVKRSFELGDTDWKQGAFVPEYRMRKKDGSEVWVEMTVKPLKAGSKDFVLGIKRDITLRRNYEASLKEERDRAQKYLDVAGVILVVIDAGQKVSMINKKGCEVLGYKEEEAAGKNWFDNFIPECVRENVRDVFKKLITGDIGPVEYFENRVLTRGGKERVIAWRNTPLKDNEGRIYATLSSGEDVTERNMAEEALLKAHEELEFKVAERTSMLKNANEALESEIKERLRAQEMLQTILEGTSSVAGQEFHRSLVRHLASALKFRYAFVGEITGSGRSVRTLALWANGGFVDNFEYSLADTPCDNVVGKTVCSYTSGVREIFPKDRLLAEMGVESYIGVPLFDSSNRPLGILVAMDDKPMNDRPDAVAILTAFAVRAALELERKRTEDELKKSEEMLRAVIDNSRAVIYLKDKDGRFMLINRWYEELFNVRGENIIGKTDHDLFPAEVADSFRANDRVVLEANRPMSFEETALEPDGMMHTYLSMKFPIQGMPGVICGISTDITGRKLMEEELRKNEERLKEAQHIARIGNWEWDVVNDNIFWSDEVYRIFGLTTKGFGATYEVFLNAVHPEDRGYVAESVKNALGGSPYSIDHRIVRPDGIVVIVHEQARATFDKNGRAVRMAGTVQDVTEARIAEEKLRESEKKFRNLIENTPIGISITTEDGSVLEANAALWKLFGCDSKEEFLKLKVPSFYQDPEDRKEFLRLLKQHGAVKDFEVKAKRRDGSKFLGSLTSLAQDAGAGKVQFISIFQDITARKKMEEEILKAQKLESIGDLAGGIAHDFNNLLLGVLGNAAVGKNYLNKEDKVYGILSDIENAALRAKSLSRQLLTFSKGGEPVKEAAGVEELIKDAARLVLRGTDCSCVFSFPKDLRQVNIDEGQISQVMNNVILNSVQSMPNGGEINISAGNAVVASEDLLPLEAGDYVRIAIKDHGAGIPKKIIHKVFDPFFTTKTRAGGLGLAVSYSIIKKHNGYIGVESEEGRGATFYIYLPASKKGSVAKNAGENIAGAGRVLVMDDEELVRDVTGEMLTLLGYEPHFSQKGEEAVLLYRKARESGAPFDAVILDLTVPGGMGGVETMRKLLEIDPDVKAIVSSGYSKAPIMSEYKKYGFSGVISKPYRVAEFSKIVKDVMEGKG